MDTQKSRFKTNARFELLQYLCVISYMYIAIFDDYWSSNNLPTVRAHVHLQHSFLNVSYKTYPGIILKHFNYCSFTFIVYLYSNEYIGTVDFWCLPRYTWHISPPCTLYTRHQLRLVHFGIQKQLIDPRRSLDWGLWYCPEHTICMNLCVFCL